MGFFHQYFRLRSKSPYDFLVFDGVGPAGPVGPAGAAGAAGANGQNWPDYDDVAVDLGIDYAPIGNGISRVCVIQFGGPNGSEITVAHGVAGLTDIGVLSMRAVVQPIAGSDAFPIPSSDGPNLAVFSQTITLRVDGTNVYIASSGNLAGQFILVIIDFLT